MTAPPPTPPSSRARKRLAPRLRTAGALLLLVGAVALADRLLPRSPDPVLGSERSTVVWAAVIVMLGVGAALFWLGRRWR